MLWCSVIFKDHNCESFSQIGNSHLPDSPCQFSQRSRFGSTGPPSWVYVAVNQRQSWCPEIAERSQPRLLIGWCRCSTRWPRWPESRPLAELSRVEMCKPRLSKTAIPSIFPKVSTVCRGVFENGSSPEASTSKTSSHDNDDAPLLQPSLATYTKAKKMKIERDHNYAAPGRVLMENTL